MSKLLRDIYRDFKKSLSKLDDELDRRFEQAIIKKPMYKLAEAVATTFIEKADDEMQFEPIAVMGTASFEHILGMVLSTIDSADREHFLILLLTAIYYKLALGNSYAKLSDFHPSFFNEEQDS